MPVKAPFRFARINRWIHEPDWARLVSHDVPFADGLSGEAVVEITATSSILIGGDRRKAAKQKRGEVRPFRLPDGRYAIPGSALQGMVRSILEIAAFGRLGPRVKDRKFGIRDLSRSATGKAHYQRRLSQKTGKKVTMNSMAGWLIKGLDDKPRIVKCEYARIRLDDVLSFAQASPAGPSSDAVLYQRSDANARYEWFLNGRNNSTLNSVFTLHKLKWHPHRGGKILIQYQRCVQSAAGTTQGTLVFTGKPTSGTGRGKKNLEFVFYNPDRAGASGKRRVALPVSDDVWDAFGLLHEEQPGRPINPNWKFWKGEYKKGEPVPVFYWKDGGRVETFGMAFAFKAAHTQSTHELLENSCPGHVTPVAEMPLDLPHLIFGVAAEHENGRGLKRRARFGLALAPENSKLQECRPKNPSVLLGPKPGYAGIYVRQRYDNKPTPLADANPLATYTPYRPPSGPPTPDHLQQPELSGVKIWPARHSDDPQCSAFHPDEIAKGLENSPQVQTDLVTLPPGTVFSSRLTFHNLRPAELGALLWALSFGDLAAFGDNAQNVKLRHRLGMGKPLGLGEVGIRVIGLQTEPALLSQRSAWTENCLVGAFEAHMAEAYDPADLSKWRGSKQVKALLLAARPGATQDLEYMVLDTNSRRNDFDAARSKGEYLPDYARGDEKR